DREPCARRRASPHNRCARRNCCSRAQPPRRSARNDRDCAAPPGMPYPVTIERHYRQKKGPCMQQIAAAAALPGAETMWVVTILFVLTYVLIVAERINRSIIALLGAGAMILSGVLSQDEAIRGIDFNTIALLTGMMVLVAIARRCGMFEYLAVWSAQKGRAQPWAILAMLSVVTAFVSSLLDNVTTVLLIAPVTLEIARHLETPPYVPVRRGVRL